MSDRARELFRTGVKHLKAEPPDYRAAFASFKDAYADSPSPKILGNLGLAAAKIERDGEALDAYERYLKEAGAKSLSERRAIDADMQQLRARLARLRLAGLPEDAVVIDRRRDGAETIENRYEPGQRSWTVGLRAGAHELTIEAEGFETETVTVELAPGDEEARGLEMSSLSPDPTPTVLDAPTPVEDEGREPQDADGITIGMWAAIGTTAALGIGTGIVAALAASNFASFEEVRDAGDTARADDLRSKGETLNLAGDVLIGLTAAAGAASVVLIVLEVSEPDQGDTALRLTPVITHQGAFVGLGGSF